MSGTHTRVRRDAFGVALDPQVKARIKAGVVRRSFTRDLT